METILRRAGAPGAHSSPGAKSGWAPCSPRGFAGAPGQASPAGPVLSTGALGEPRALFSPVACGTFTGRRASLPEGGCSYRCHPLGVTVLLFMVEGQGRAQVTTPHQCGLSPRCGPWLFDVDTRAELGAVPTRVCPCAWCVADRPCGHRVGWEQLPLSPRRGGFVGPRAGHGACGSPARQSCTRPTVGRGPRLVRA